MTNTECLRQIVPGAKECKMLMLRKGRMEEIDVK